MRFLSRFSNFSIFIPTVFIFCLPVSAFAVAGDEHWDAQFGLPGTTNSIAALAVNNGTLVAGGLNTLTTNTQLISWDGNQFSSLGTFGNGLSTTTIYDTAYVGSILYVTGTFSTVSGSTATGLASWNGSSWTDIGLEGTGLSLAVSGSDLYVGGFFTTPDTSGIIMTNIGRWDGTSWHALGSGLNGSYGGYVRCLAATNGLIYAGGSLTNSGNLAITNLAVWNGSFWSGVGGGVNGVIYGLGCNGGNLYAAGAFTQAGTIPANYVAQWNGVNWFALSSGLSGQGNSVAFLNNQVCVTGSFTSAGGTAATNFAVWNGSAWSAAGAGVSSTGLRVISNGTNVYVGGGFGVAGNGYVGGIAAWDGNNWSGLGTVGRTNGLQSSVFSFANDGSNLYAGGLFTSTSQTNVNYTARFDGTNWYSLGGGVGPPGGITIVRATAYGNNNFYAGGYFSTAGGVTAQNIACWNGINWTAMANGPGGLVASILIQPSGIYVAGAPVVGNQYGVPFFEVWNGSSWQSPLNFPPYTFTTFHTSDPNIGMDALVSLGTNIFIGGHFSIGEYGNYPNNYTNCNNIMRFDGNYAWVVGTGLNSNVVAMTTLGSNLYVAGLFTNAGGVTANHIAMWNGNTWSAVGGGVVGTGTVAAIATLGSNLYAGGTFTNMGGQAAAQIAKWDGTNWYALGSGASPATPAGAVLTFAPFGSNLFVGGSFFNMGGKLSRGLARWNDQLNFNSPQVLNPAWLSNGQFQMKVNGLAGLTNLVQATTNLSNWTTIATNMTGIYEFIDSSASNYPNRFYRAKLGP